MYVIKMLCSGFHCFTNSFNKTWTQVLCEFKSCFPCVRDLQWWESLAKMLATILHHHHQSIKTTENTCYVLNITISKKLCLLKLSYKDNGMLAFSLLWSLMLLSYKTCTMPNKQKFSQLLQQRHRRRFSHSVSASDFEQVIVCLVLDFFMWNLLCFTGQLFSNSDFIRVTHTVFVVQKQLCKKSRLWQLSF